MYTACSFVTVSCSKLPCLQRCQTLVVKMQGSLAVLDQTCTAGRLAHADMALFGRDGHVA